MLRIKNFLPLGVKHSLYISMPFGRLLSSDSFHYFLKLFTGSRANILQKAKVNVIETEKCRSWYKAQGKKTKIQETQLCAGHEQGGIDACWVSIRIISNILPTKCSFL